MTYTIGKLYIVCQSLTIASVELSIPNQSQIKNVKIFCNDVYTDTGPRNVLKNNNQKFYLQLLDFVGNFSNLETQTNVVTISLLPHMNTKGYFIEGDISRVNKITIHDDGDHIILHYDKTTDNSQIQFKQITPRLHMISKPNTDYKSMKYSESIAETYINNGKMTIEYSSLDDINIDPIYAHAISQNIIQYENGFTNLAFTNSVHPKFCDAGFTNVTFDQV